LITRDTFRRRAENELIILDGGLGTLLQARGLGVGQAPEELNLARPDLVEACQREFVRAGAQVLLTNTFGATALKLADHGLEAKAGQINAAAVALARRAAGDTGAWVAGSLGPTGRLLQPLGSLEFRAAYAAYRDQVLALARAGVDLLILETMSDLREARAALMAAREGFAGPIIAMMTFADGRHTVTGTDPLAALTVLEALDADAFGLNCSTGPAEIFAALGEILDKTALPLGVEPNAGMPRLHEGRTCFPASPQEMADYAVRFAEAGVSLIGACCGAGPDHVAAMARALQGRRPAPRPYAGPVPRLASRRRAVEIGPGQPLRVIGERINPTGRQALRRELAAGDYTRVRKDAADQVQAGADILDVNAGAPGLDEPAVLGAAVRAAQQAADAPISIDTSDPAALEAALEEIEGRALINSVTAEDERLDRVLPLAKKWGAAVLGLTLDARGIPATAEERLALGRKIVDRALAAGLRREDVFLDPLTLAVSAEPAGPAEALKALRAVKRELGAATVMGVSNVSFGLPQRPLVNRAFLAMALEAGLDLPILNPFSAEMMETVHAAGLLLGRDPGAARFIARYGGEAPAESRPAGAAQGVDQRLREAVMYGHREAVAALVDEALAQGWEAMAVNEQVLIPALQEVGRRYDRKEFFLPQMILAAETMQAAFARLKDRFPAGQVPRRGTVLLATVKGDVHDIGKNVVATVLANYGWRVVDLGKNVEAGRIVQRAREERADFVGLSALMTTTMTEMGPVIRGLKAEGIPARVIVGGAVLSAEYAREIGADGYGRDAMEAVRLVDLLREGDRK